MPKGMHNPLPASLGSECVKATQILDSFIHGSWRGSPGRELPERVLRNAKGLAVLTVTKAGLLGSIRFGSGILIARLPDNNNNDDNNHGSGGWSPPSAISIAGVGFGGQAGFELADFVFILNDTDSLATFSNLGSLTVSGNFSIAFGPVGRNAEVVGGVSTNGGGKMMSFAKTHGLFGGVSLESGVLVERRWANRRFYGRKVTAAEILEGRVEVPVGENGGADEGISGLMRVLEEVFAVGDHSPDDSGSIGVQDGGQQANQEGQLSADSGGPLHEVRRSNGNQYGDREANEESQPSSRSAEPSHHGPSPGESQDGEQQASQEKQAVARPEATSN